MLESLYSNLKSESNDVYSPWSHSVIVLTIVYTFTGKQAEITNFSRDQINIAKSSKQYVLRKKLSIQNFPNSIFSESKFWG